MEKEPIKSPFTGETRVIHKSTDPQELAEAIVENFGKLLRQHEEEKQEVDQNTFVNYLAGATSALMIIGFGKDGTEMVVDEVNKIIDDIAQNGCGECENCKQEN